MDSIFSTMGGSCKTINQEIDLVVKALDTEIIGRLAIDTINSAIRAIDLREERQVGDLEAEPESTQVIRLITNKVKLILENVDHSSENFISLFYLSKVSDFPQIMEIFQRVLGKARSTGDSEKKRLVENIAKLIPASLSANQLEEDFSELVRQVDEKYLDVTLIEGKLRDIRERNETKKKVQKKTEELKELVRFQKDSVIPLKKADSQASFIGKVAFPFEKWIFFEENFDQTKEDSDDLGNLCSRILNNPELVDAIKQAKQSMQCVNNNILVFLGTTQVGKSSTLNFLSGQTPFIERGYIYLEDFIELDKDTDQQSASKSSEKIFKYLIEADLIGLDSLDEDISPSNPQFYVPKFKVGERISNKKDNIDKEKLREFILNNFPEKNTEILFKFIVDQLEGAIRKKDRSEKDQPGVGFRSPVFSCGVGASKTIIAQAKNQIWNTTTMDLPGSDDHRGREYLLVSAFSTYCALAQTSCVKGGAIVLAYHQLTGDATNFVNLINILSFADNMMGESIDPSNMCILVTKVPLTKKLKGKLIPLAFEEIRNLVLNELNKFNNLLARDGTPEFLRLKDLLEKIIEGKRVLPVTPLKEMDVDFSEKSDPDNINKENIEQIINMCSCLGLIRVTPGYFSRIYSSKNINVSKIIGQIEDYVLNASSIILSELKSLESLSNALQEKQLRISTDIQVAKEYLDEVVRCLEIEQRLFDEAMKRHLSEYDNRGDFKKPISEMVFGSFQTGGYSSRKIKAQEIKELAMVAAKKGAIGEARWFESMYISTAQTGIDSYEKEKEKIKESMNRLEQAIARLESKKKTDGMREEILQSQSFTPLDHYFYPGDQRITLEDSSDRSFIKPTYDLRASQGKFSVKIIQSRSTYQFELGVTEKAGFFSKYKMTCQALLTASVSDLADHEIKAKKAELNLLQLELINVEGRLKILKETEEKNKEFYSLEEQRQKILFDTQKEYRKSLTELQEQLGMKNDKSQIMSRSDIRKIMIGVLVQNAHESLQGVRHTLSETEKFFNNPDRLAKIFKVNSAIKNYRILEELLLINKALNFQSRYDKTVAAMSIDEMEKAVKRVKSLEEEIKKNVLYFKNCRPVIEDIRRREDQIKLDIDKYDSELERRVDQSSTCVIQ